ncbi:MAG: oxidoreductase, partial [Acidobacteria bacterium]
MTTRITTSTNYRVGLVGAGHISEFHVRALRRLPNVTLVGVTDLDLCRAQALAERFRLPGAYPSLDALA